jgi:hypothetical protein
MVHSQNAAILKILYKKLPSGWAQWCIPRIPAFRRLKHKYHEFKTSLDYIMKPCLKNKNCLQAMCICIYET